MPPRISILALFSIAALLAEGASADPAFSCPHGTKLDRTLYPDGTPKRILCLRPDGVPEGPFVSYNPSGLPYERGEYANLSHLGLLAPSYVGFVDRWHPNGQLYSRTQYLRGREHGLVEYFDAQGRRQRTEVFKEGRVIDIYDGDSSHEIECPPSTSPASSSFVPGTRAHSIDKWCERQQPPVGSVHEGPSIHIDASGAVTHRCENRVRYAAGVWYYKLRCSERGGPFGDWSCWRYDLDVGGSTGIPCPD